MTDFDLSTEEGVLDHARFLVGQTPLPMYYAMDDSGSVYAYGYVGMGEWDAYEIEDGRRKIIKKLVEEQRLIVESERNLYGLKLKLLVPAD